MIQERVNTIKILLPFEKLMEQQYEIRRPALAAAQTRVFRKNIGFNNQQGEDSQKPEQLHVAGNG